MADSYTGDDWMISVDDHLIEPPSVWVDRLPAKYRDLGPRWISDDKGEAWLIEESRRTPVSGAVTAGAVWPPEGRPGPFTPMPWSEIPPACYDPKARGEAMDTDHVLASLMFPNLPGFAGSLFLSMQDKELALLCVQAYNDWILDEYAAALPGRIIGLALLPLWDGQLCAQEAERALAKGARAVSFSMAPANLGLPPIHDESWDPLYSVMNNANLPLCTHLGTGFGSDMSAMQRQQPDFGKLGDMAKDGGADMEKMQKLIEDGDFGELMKMMGGGDGGSRTPRPATGVLLQLAGQTTLVEWLNSGNFDRFPNLKVALVGKRHRLDPVGAAGGRLDAGDERATDHDAVRPRERRPPHRRGPADGAGVDRDAGPRWSPRRRRRRRSSSSTCTAASSTTRSGSSSSTSSGSTT